MRAPSCWVLVWTLCRLQTGAGFKQAFGVITAVSLPGKFVCNSPELESLRRLAALGPFRTA